MTKNLRSAVFLLIWKLYLVKSTGPTVRLREFQLRGFIHVNYFVLRSGQKIRGTF